MKHQGNIKQDEIGTILIFLIPLGLAVVSALIYGIGASINVLSSNQNIAIPALNVLRISAISFLIVFLLEIAATFMLEPIINRDASYNNNSQTKQENNKSKDTFQELEGDNYNQQATNYQQKWLIFCLYKLLKALHN